MLISVDDIKRESDPAICYCPQVPFIPSRACSETLYQPAQGVDSNMISSTKKVSAKAASMIRHQYGSTLATLHRYASALKSEKAQAVAVDVCKLMSVCVVGCYVALKSTFAS